MLEMAVNDPIARITEPGNRDDSSATIMPSNISPSAGPKILIADDEPPLVRLLEFLLSRQGYTVFTAGNGEDALEVVRKHRPDLILLDVMMPRLDGFAVAAILRADPELSHIPIVMLTARAQEDDIERGHAVGVDDYITKPFEPDRLATVIAHYTKSGASSLGGQK